MTYMATPKLLVLELHSRAMNESPMNGAKNDVLAVFRRLLLIARGFSPDADVEIGDHAEIR